MGENQKRILQMLAEGKVTVDEASRLLSLLDKESGGDAKNTDGTARPQPKYLYVKVEPKEGHVHSGHWGEHGKVNIRVPVSLVKAGMKLSALMPPHVADDVNQALEEKGIKFDIRNLKDEYVQQLVEALSDTEINVDSEEATVKVYAE